MPASTHDRICSSALDMIGNTPMVYLNKVTEGLEAKIAVKCEWFNPACSVKDRVGLVMIQKAEQEGRLKKGDVLIEPTSGNMGLGLAWAAKLLGYKLILVMPSSMSLERRTALKAFGAELILTEPSRAVLGSLERAQELQKKIGNAVILNQFANRDNIEAHYTTTGPEVWNQTQGAVDLVVYGVGSGGTLEGVGKYLKEKKPSVKVYAVEPYEASVINGHPHGPHTIPGTGAGMVPEILDKIYEEALRIKSADAVEMAKRLALEEGLMAGISSGANVCAAIELAKRKENKGKLIVSSLADFGERYLSTLLYNTIKEEAAAMAETTLEEDLAALKKKWGSF